MALWFSIQSHFHSIMSSESIGCCAMLLQSVVCCRTQCSSDRMTESSSGALGINIQTILLLYPGLRFVRNVFLFSHVDDLLYLNMKFKLATE